MSEDASLFEWVEKSKVRPYWEREWRNVKREKIAREEQFGRPDQQL